MRRTKLWIYAILLSMTLSACGESEVSTNSNASQEIVEEEPSSSNETEFSTDAEEESSDEQFTENTDNQAPLETESQSADIAFALEDIEPYSGTPYVTVNGNVPYFSENDLLSQSFEDYSDLDNLGRCGVAYANIGLDIMPTEDREGIGQIKPTGWHTVKYDVVDGKYLYNRCHLIGFQLAGENANEKNLITGTRYLNVDGMLPFENMVADYVKETENHVLYRVTPIFEGDNLVASGVLMEAESVEDQGEDILFCVYVYNVQPGVSIDYATGESSLEEGIQAPESEIIQEQESESQIQADEPETESETAQDPEPQGTTYILNTNTKKFHYPSCSSVGQMKESNKQEFTGNRDDVISQGYDPCKKCNP